MTSRIIVRTVVGIGAYLLCAALAGPAEAQIKGGTGTGTGTGGGTGMGIGTGTGTGGTKTGVATGIGTGTGTGTTTGTTTTTPSAATSILSLTPELELQVLIDSILAMEFLMQEMNLQFGNDSEAFLFLSIIYQLQYQATLQAQLLNGGGAGLVFLPGVSLPGTGQ